MTWAQLWKQNVIVFLQIWGADLGRLGEAIPFFPKISKTRKTWVIQYNYFSFFRFQANHSNFVLKLLSALEVVMIYPNIHPMSHVLRPWIKYWYWHLDSILINNCEHLVWFVCVSMWYWLTFNYAKSLYSKMHLY